ncbi:MAG: hypothetical protein IJ169_06450 [Paludibacteraceae bacterium]|nr:hypothetical protein [Paludibacteraceae bacterium]
MKRLLLLLLFALFLLPCRAADDLYGAEPLEVTAISVSATYAELDRFPAGFFDIGLRDDKGNRLELRLISKAASLPSGTFPIASQSEGLDEYVQVSDGFHSGTGLNWQSRSYLQTADGVLYFLLSGSVTVSARGKRHTVSVQALSAHGSSVTVTFSGTMAETAFADEPRETTVISDTGTKLAYKLFGYSMTDIVIYTASGGALWLSIYSQDIFPTGTFQINNNHDTSVMSVLASAGNNQPSFYQTVDHYWYLASGTVRIERRGRSWMFDVDAYTHYGSHIMVRYEGDAVNGNAPDYDAEPATPTVIDRLVPEVELQPANGLLGVYLLDKDVEASVLLVTSDSLPPEGVHEVRTDSLPGSVIASVGGTDTYDYGTFYACMREDGSWSGTTYYIVSGTFSVSREGDIYTLLLDGISYGGSSVRVSYTGPLLTTSGLHDPVGGEDDSFGGGSSFGGKDSPDSQCYTLTGIPVGRNYHGIIIHSGRKYYIP